MKRIIRTVLCVICLVIGMIMLLAGCVYYITNSKKTLRDTSISPNGKYELSLMEIGEPAWPFGPASGRLILNEGDTQISETNFRLANDGCSISSNDWAVTWNEDHVEVILSGEEQYDEQILLYYDGTTQHQYLTEEIEPAETQPEVEIQRLDIGIRENRENELVFDISIDDFIDSYNSLYTKEHNRPYFTPSSEWQWYLYDTAIHSAYETFYVYFTEDERIYSQSTVSVYVPSNCNYIQEITINFDEHSYSESGYEQYKQMCFYALKVFFPDLSDEAILNLCTEAITLGNVNTFSSDEWYDSDSIPCALFYKDGIGVYPYFAIGDWEHFCIIPVAQETIDSYEQKGVEIYEIE